MLYAMINRRQVFGSFAFIGGIFAASTFAKAGNLNPYVGVQFVLAAPALNSTDVTGVIPQGDFNPVFITAGAGTSGTTNDLMDANGNVTPITLTHVSHDGFHTNTFTTTPNGVLLRGEDKSGSGGQTSPPGLTSTYTFNGVPDGTYALIAYTENDLAGVNADLTAGSTTYYITDELGAGSPPFTLANNTDSSNRITGNYVEFSNITPVGGTITLTNTSQGGGNNTASINGLQLVLDLNPVWSGGGLDANWMTAGNWIGGNPVSPEPLTFDGNTGLVNNNDYAAGMQFNGVTFNAGAGSFVLGGNAIALGSDVVNNSPNLQTLNMDLALQANINFDAAAGGLAVGGNISGAFSLTKTGSNTLTLTGGNNTFSGGTTVSAGTLIIGANGALPTNSSVVISGNSTMQLAPSTGLATLSSLSIDSAAKLDITNNHIIINYSGSDPIATIVGYLRSGYVGGKWNGPGIDSSAAAAGGGRYGVGYADGSDGVVIGLAPGQIEVAYALYGDANLNGVVDGDDFTIVTDNLGRAVNGWDRGDFNYDGVVSGDDFTLLVENLGKAADGADVTIPAADYAAIYAFAAANGLMADVPEPGAAVLMIAGFSILHHRRGRASSSTERPCV